MIATKLYENGRYLALVVLSTIVVGITSYNSLGRQEDPSITPFVASVQTFYPGASPARNAPPLNIRFGPHRGFDPVFWKIPFEQQKPYQVSCCRVLPKRSGTTEFPGL